MHLRSLDWSIWLEGKGKMNNLSMPEVLTFFMSVLPISEARGAIPFALAQGLSPLRAYLIGVIGNLVPVLPLLVGVKKLFTLSYRYEIGRKIFTWINRLSTKRERIVRRYGFVGLTLLVAVPLPVTGAWTGSLVSAFLGLSIKYAFLAIFIGVCISAAIVLMTTLGIIEVLGM